MQIRSSKNDLANKSHEIAWLFLSEEINPRAFSDMQIKMRSLVFVHICEIVAEHCNYRRLFRSTETLWEFSWTNEAATRCLQQSHILCPYFTHAWFVGRQSRCFQFMLIPYDSEYTRKYVLHMNDGMLICDTKPSCFSGWASDDNIFFAWNTAQTQSAGSG